MNVDAPHATSFSRSTPGATPAIPARCPRRSAVPTRRDGAADPRRRRRRARAAFLPAATAALLAAAAAPGATAFAASASTASAQAASRAPIPQVPDGDVVEGETGRKLDAWLERLSGAGFAGVALVAKDGRVVLSKGYGLADRERKIPNTSRTVISIGSITKQFTGAAVMKLEEQGKLSAGDPISKHLPGVPADKQAITIHHLLTHTAGLRGDYGRTDYEEVGRDAYVRRVLDAPLESRPGATYRYSNAGFSLAAAIVEIVSGRSYERFLHDELFAPAGMTETGYRIPSWPGERIPVGYRDGERWGTILERIAKGDGPYWNLRGNGGIHATVADMYRWHLALQGDAVLSKASREKLQAPHVPEPGGDTSYGYGWSVGTTPRGTRLVEHNGGNGVFFADFKRFVDEGTVVVVASNGEMSAILAGPILARIAFGEEVPLPPAAVAMPREARERLAGTYALPSGARFDVSADPSGGLRIAPEGREAHTALSTEPPPRDPEAARRAEERVTRMLEGAARGDYAAIAEAFGGRMPVERVREIESEMARDREARLGKYVGFEILGTTEGPDGLRTRARVKHERGGPTIEYIWHGDVLAGISARPPGSGPRFVPVSATEFVAFSLQDGGGARVVFETDDKGAGTALVVRRPGGDVRAARR